MSALNSLNALVSQIGQFLRRPVAPRSDADHDSEDGPISDHDNARSDGPVLEKNNSEILSNFISSAQEDSLLKRLTNSKHREATKLWGKLCHRIDAAYPPKDQLQPIDVDAVSDPIHHNVDDSTFGVDQPRYRSSSTMMDDIRYSLRHAFCAYQPAVVALKSEEMSLAFKSQTAMLMACFSLSAEDILIDHCSLQLDRLVTRAHEPAYYLAVDHKMQCIVLSIRGTSSVGDILTDLNAKSKRHRMSGTTGFVHEGMLQSAQFMYESVTSTVVTACHRHRGYRVVVTGHSLGAGVAALLGLMYKDHPAIYGQDGARLRVWCFASPCIVSREFTDNALGNAFITSIALETDVVTRLSMESVRKYNLRQDFIMTHAQCSSAMLQDVLRRDHLEDESESAEFLRILKTLESPKPQEQLFPMGRILWFVPRIVMDDDIVFRRRTLMKMLVDHGAADGDDGIDGAVEEKECGQEEGLESSANEVVEEMEGKQDDAVPEWRRTLNASMRNLQEGLRVRSQSVGLNANNLWREMCHDVSRGVKDFQTDIRCKMDSSRRRRKYGASNYVLCDATKCRYMFQEFICDFPESLQSHNPQRYLWACDATLRQ